jgi:hypothetical protein
MCDEDWNIKSKKYPAPMKYKMIHVIILAALLLIGVTLNICAYHIAEGRNQRAIKEQGDGQ